MKKIICMLLLVLSGSMIAQTKTLVTPNGEKVTVIPNAGTADNGLTATSGKAQLGGVLIKPTTINTSSTNLLEIKSNGTSTTPVSAIKITDTNQGSGKVLVSNATGLATWGANIGVQSCLYKSYNASTATNFILPANTYVSIPGLDQEYVAQVSGKYQFIFHSFFVSSTGDLLSVRQFYFTIWRGGTVLSRDETYSYVGSYFNTHISRILTLNAGDRVHFTFDTMSSGFVIPPGLAGRNNVEAMFLGL